MLEKNQQIYIRIKEKKLSKLSLSMKGIDQETGREEEGWGEGGGEGEEGGGGGGGGEGRRGGVGVEGVSEVV